ncbi:MAG: hypothetical protein WAV04_03530 [Candidatus Microsaccharimonas sp.]
MSKSSQSGFHLWIILVAVAAIGVIGLLGWVFITNSNKTTSEVQWAFDEQKIAWYTKTGTAPDCKDPFVFDQSPIEPSLLTAVLMPGSYRGFSYKPHGGFGVPNETLGKVEVRMPMDATLVGLTRYYEGDPADLQYLLTFENDCGIAFRFDHIYKLSPELEALAEKTPEPKVNDTRTSPEDNPPRTKFTSGQVIATQVGLPSMGIYGFDFGVYDYRKQNDISKNPTWANIHNKFQSLDWYGVCWYDMLPDADPDRLRALSLEQTDTRQVVKKVSDYCSHAPYTTLDVNNGQPTDG